MSIPHILLVVLFSCVSFIASATEPDSFWLVVAQYMPEELPSDLKYLNLNQSEVQHKALAQADAHEASTRDSSSFIAKAAAYIMAKNDDLSPKEAKAYASYIEQASEEHDLDRRLLLALIRIESNFDAKAVSGHGARGLTQIVPRYHAEKLRAFSAISGQHRASIMHPRVNIFVGAQILRDCIDRSKSITAALLRYNGSLNDRTKVYAKSVLREYSAVKALL